MGIFNSGTKGLHVRLLIKHGQRIERTDAKLLPSTDSTYEIWYKFHGYKHKAITPKGMDFTYMGDMPIFGVVFGEMTAQPLLTPMGNSETLVTEFLNSQIIRQSIDAVRKKPFDVKFIFILLAIVLVLGVGVYFFTKKTAPDTTSDTTPPITTTITPPDITSPVIEG